MHYADLEPRTAALLDTATDDAFFAVLGELLDDGLDPHVLLERRAPSFVVLVIGLSGDTIQVERTLMIDWSALDERTRYGVLLVWVSQILAANERRVRQLNVKLVAQGVAPIVLPKSSP